MARVFFRVGYFRALGVMVLANYFSLLCAGLLVGPVTVALGDAMFRGPRLVHLVHLLALAVPVSFVLTVVFEWPLCVWLMRGRPRRVVTGLLFCVVSQVVTYAMLAPFHMGVADHMRREIGAVAAHTRGARNADATVYYLDNERGDLWSIRLDGADRQRVCAAGETDEEAVLFPKRTAAGVRLFVGNSANGAWQERDLAALPADVCARTAIRRSGVRMNLEEMSFRDWNDRYGFDMRSDDDKHACDAEVKLLRLGVWCPRPLDEVHRPLTSDRDVRYQTPFRVYWWSALNLLPRNEAVAQVDGQVVLVDLEGPVTRFLVEGHSPFVVLSQPAMEPPAAVEAASAAAFPAST